MCMQLVWIPLWCEPKDGLTCNLLRKMRKTSFWLGSKALYAKNQRMNERRTNAAINQWQENPWHSIRMLKSSVCVWMWWNQAYLLYHNTYERGNVKIAQCTTIFTLITLHQALTSSVDHIMFSGFYFVKLWELIEYS